MPQPRHGAEFLLEPFFTFLGKQGLTQDFQRQQLIAVEEIFDQEDLPHPTLPEGSEDAIAMVQNSAGLGQGGSPEAVSVGDSARKSTTIRESDQVVS
jgi:hypothetical protein